MASQYWKLWRETLEKMPTFDDGFSREYEKDCGLYLMGTTSFNPLTDDKYYWVKVGLSRNLESRMQQYRTNNPAMFLIDVEIVDNSEVAEMERYYQLILMNKAMAKSCFNEEWFMVDRNTYLEICNKKFAWFWQG